ncbi:MAG: DNA-processing protein DprA [Phycisphaerales bacterium]
MARAPAEIPEAMLRLALCAGVGPACLHEAAAAFGGWEAVASAGAADLARVPGVGAARAEAIRAQLDAVDADGERRAMERAGVRAVLAGDGDYPRLMEMLPRMPPILWVRGDLEALAADSVGIVGARRATAYGRAQAGRFAAAAAAEGIAVVSGGARGVDAEAHRAALRVGGPTVAVLGSGLGDPYPIEHAALFESIVEAGGLLVSEFPTLFPPLPANFPRRNRIISALSMAVLVVEAGTTSGALITARHAVDDHGRAPCALPGPVDSPRSAGCNAAIRDGWVQAVLDPEDLLAAVDEAARRLGPPAPDAAGASAIPESLRPLVVRAAALLSRRPRIGDEDLAATLGTDVPTSRAVRTFAALAAAGSRRRAGRARRTEVAGPGGQFQPMA